VTSNKCSFNVQYYLLYYLYLHTNIYYVQKKDWKNNNKLIGERRTKSLEQSQLQEKKERKKERKKPSMEFYHFQNLRLEQMKNEQRKIDYKYQQSTINF